MKVLWLTLTPCGASKKLSPNIHITGWLSSLEQQIKLINNIELSVCFYHNGELEPFEYNSVKYYPIQRGDGSSNFNKFKNRLNLFNPNFDTPYITKLIQIIRKIKPDIIHIHGSEENFGLIQSSIDVPTVISIQGLLNPCSEKFFSGIPLKYASQNEGFINKILFNSAKHQYFLFLKWAKREKKILKISKYIIGRTNWDRRVTHVLAPQSKYFVGNEIMRDSFYKKKWNKKKFNTKIQIVTTMSNGIFKGLESVLKTASILTDLGNNFEWLIIGQSYTESYPKMIKAWLKKDFKENNVILLGKKNETNVATILCSSDIYCQVSHIENSPNSLCEAMLLGMPIVATFAGGTDSILNNNSEGLLVQDGDPYSIAGAILELTNNYQKSKQMGLNARKTALERHNPTKVTNEIIEIYKEIYKTK